jgi:hypothetical protein
MARHKICAVLSTSEMICYGGICQTVPFMTQVCSFPVSPQPSGTPTCVAIGDETLGTGQCNRGGWHEFGPLAAAIYFPSHLIPGIPHPSYKMLIKCTLAGVIAFSSCMIGRTGYDIVWGSGQWLLYLRGPVTQEFIFLKNLMTSDKLILLCICHGVSVLELPWHFHL